MPYFFLLKNRALSVTHSLIITGEYRHLSHSIFCKASLLGYDLTILFYSYFPKSLPGPSFFPLPLQSKQIINQFSHRLQRLPKRSKDKQLPRRGDKNKQKGAKEVEKKKIGRPINYMIHTDKSQTQRTHAKSKKYYIHSPNFYMQSLNKKNSPLIFRAHVKKGSPNQNRY